jgi:hypothetical protein
MAVYSVVILDDNGHVLVQRNFPNHVDRDTYADILIDIISKLEGRKVKRVDKLILKENPGLKKVLVRAREIEEKFVIAELTT